MRYFDVAAQAAWIGSSRADNAKVGEQRAVCTTLRRAGHPSFESSQIGKQTSLEKHLAQIDHLAIGDASTDAFDHGAVPNFVEAAFDVALDQPRVAVVDVVS
ncbi:hypothetical protein O7543_06505 [Solwaraspora sp. WMMA2080]|uniref:hypothetical protein n=1 Tax=unclassified Solwaraspora TaxID=2627926 RepID=UPI00248B6189|nr:MULTISPECIES: hypothetical protein [unclassified Solwaraspora]WBB99337.1 hypothetical protein O7553_10870 [Solwaraspora sp. WMMA2059]WBC22113.1 hypothetical protein O7543_06505 [Solwaraspora sp. WMMA2080]WJK35847.1 hypothetical protein O7610_05655 [Solwaraspora sp. WMMA2065]